MLACCYPTRASTGRAYIQAIMRWYLKISWFMHTTSTVLAVGVAVSYWALLCTYKKWLSSHSTSYNTTNLTQSMSCQPTPINVIFHGGNAIIALFDIFISSVPVPLSHFFYTSILTFFYFIFSLIYWGAYYPSNIGVIYPILDYSNHSYKTGCVAAALIFAPMLLFLMPFGIVLLRDYLAKKMCASRKVKEIANAKDDENLPLSSKKEELM